MENFANPVRPRASKSKISELYPYYAGFSPEFASDAARWLAPSKNDIILDPWNGAGTTTSLAKEFIISTIGYDLNPVMVLVSKANLIVPHEASSIPPLTEKISKSLETQRKATSNNPLTLLFTEGTASTIRAIAVGIWEHLVSSEASESSTKHINTASPLAAVFFVGIFNTARELLSSFGTSNPTWMKIPKTEHEKINVSAQEVTLHFKNAMTRIQNLIADKCLNSPTPIASCNYGDSKKLPLDDESIDAVLTSPPYCTRLDYARATMVELLILESLNLASYQHTRISLMGSSVVNKPVHTNIPSEWGQSCKSLLEKIYEHPSKASKTYYFNSHYNYFKDLYQSISEIGRVCKPSARVCIVAQDSYYKELHNDLPEIIMEMASHQRFETHSVFPYEKKNPISLINSASSTYRNKKTPIETAILLTRS
ncbi:putative methylase [Pseudomonas brassicacearum subsp. brassicacearum NFM421]|uniref:site-specific DNA-methyltransferase (cytosine-N(4)-specific) n=1 Tax=Pseudomonas brassicacearum (strain NFM421) TaxID=994484 RepID=F2KM80_PSEBN|nr:DNA methyltransferase [Pseudomonas brassicacearum]AEA71623.1 putative methylase [Pseudomonas brassicacearum subsp. brassicacearum NFM421]